MAMETALMVPAGLNGGWETMELGEQSRWRGVRSPRLRSSKQLVTETVRAREKEEGMKELVEKVAKYLEHVFW